MQRARDVITDATMAEILNEEPHGPTAFRDAIRQQILIICTRLRVSLLVLDNLMAVSNNLLKGKSK